MSKFEVQTLFKGEIRRWLWLMAAVFAAITLYEYTSLLNGSNIISSLFSLQSSNTNSITHQSPPTPKNDDGSASALKNFSAIANPSNDAFPPGVMNLTKDHWSFEEILPSAPAPAPLGADGDNDNDIDDDDDISPVSDPTSSEQNNFNRRKHSLGGDHTTTSSSSIDQAAMGLGQVTKYSSSSTSPESPPPAAATTIILPITSKPNSTSIPPLLPPNINTSPSPPPPTPQLPPPLQEKSVPTVVTQPPLKKEKDVYSLRDMDELLTEGLRSTRSMVPLWPSVADRQLVHAKSEIQNAQPPPTATGLYGPLYRNLTQFYRSYELMERTLKVYVYKEGDKPVFHRPNLQGIYASEGWFMKHMESAKKFLTNDPNKAHLFYLPFSSQLLVTTFYVPNSHRRDNLVQYLKHYMDGIVAKYPFWNRTAGADHFLISCHDWAPDETKHIMSTCIRALCNADVKVGSFKFGKDISLPETNVHSPKTPLKSLGGKPPSKRKTLAFFAGQVAHGYLRPIILKHWGGNRDPDIKVFDKLPKTKGNRNYISYMQDSKYCICPRGYEVNSPRVVEAIFHQCVPVIISDNFIPPMFETLNWESFAVFVAEKDVPRLKEILVAIPEKRYLRLFKRVKMVQRHFLWNVKPVKYDLFHMILHSVWFNRVNQFQSQEEGVSE